jgi:transposase
MKSRKGDELKSIEGLLQNLLAIELWRGGLSQDEIAKRFGTSKSIISAMLKGVTRSIATRDRDQE